MCRCYVKLWEGEQIVAMQLTTFPSKPPSSVTILDKMIPFVESGEPNVISAPQLSSQSWIRFGTQSQGILGHSDILDAAIRILVGVNDNHFGGPGGGTYGAVQNELRQAIVAMNALNWSRCPASRRDGSLPSKGR
jgi:hypothetical protein